MAELAPNSLIDERYKVVSRLGSGGMADVFLAEDQQLGRRVALKLLHGRFAADPDFVERFRREAQAAAGLQHPNVVGIYDRGGYDATYYIAMEYLSGRTLKQLIREQAPLDPLRAIDITLQILKAARFAHRRGVIHRDLKPHNVIVDDADLAKVTDFGIARAGASDMTETGSIMGTAQYLSPEQAQGHAVAASSDLYSIGVILYEMLTARVPFDAEAAVTIALKHVSESPVPPSQINPNVPPALEQVVLWVLNKEPADRPQDADHLIEALESCRATIRAGQGGPDTTGMTAVAPVAPVAAVALAEAAGVGAVLAPVGPPERGGPDRPGPAPAEESPRRWWPWLLALLVLLLIVAAAGGAYLISRPEQRVVPPVTGEQLNLARAVLQGAGFSVYVIQVPTRHPPGIVFGESPGAGTRADKGSTVTVSVSTGPGRQSVPSVLGLSQAKATRLITGATLKLTRVIHQASSRFGAGQALGTDPASGTTVPLGSGVTLILSSGQALKAVPDVTGQSQTSATNRLTGAGFSVTTSDHRSNTVAPGEVISQDPPAGSLMAPGTTVKLVVATAPATSTVPPVVGDPAAGATSALEAAGFVVRRTTREVTIQSQDGNVVAQTPPGGSTAGKHSRVTIVVGHYTPTSSSSSTSSSSTSSSSSSSSISSSSTSTGPSSTTSTTTSTVKP